MSWKKSVEQHLSKHFNSDIAIQSVAPVSGGDINEAHKITSSFGDFFIKLNSASRFPKMFHKEALGLQLLADADVIPIPEVILTGDANDIAFLVLTYIDSSGKQAGFWDNFGKRLASLHQQSNKHFGLDHNNYIGSLFQSNKKHLTWADFFREERLEVQVKLARDNGRLDSGVVSAFERFYKKLDDIFPNEPPALVHGDLWGGNFMVNELGEAVIIDPAVYYGHREMDLGMSQLFGGFHNEFYESYHRHYPLESGWRQRLDYCNLYPLMVHVNLFGGGYAGSVKSILKNF